MPNSDLKVVALEAFSASKGFVQKGESYEADSQEEYDALVDDMGIAEPASGKDSDEAKAAKEAKAEAKAEANAEREEHGGEVQNSDAHYQVARNNPASREYEREADKEEVFIDRLMGLSADDLRELCTEYDLVGYKRGKSKEEMSDALIEQVDYETLYDGVKSKEAEKNAGEGE